MACLLILLIAFSSNPLADAVRLHPDSFSANHLLGEYYLKQSRIADGIPYLEKAHSIDPSDYTNSYDLALAYLQVKSLDKGRELIKQLLQHGDKAELHNLLADIEEAAGNTTEAALQYEAAARLDPTEKNLFDLGSDLLKHRGFEPALKVFEFGVQRYPRSAELRVGLGVNYYSLGRYDDAVQTLCEAVDLDPRDTKALNFLGKMYDISPSYADEVTKRLAGFAHNYPNNAAAQYYYALSLRKRTLAPSTAHDRSAESFLLRAVEIKPDFTDAHYELGLLYQDLQEDKKAIAQLEVAVKQRPSFLPAHYHLAQLYKKSGRAALARREFARIEELKSH